MTDSTKTWTFRVVVALFVLVGLWWAVSLVRGDAVVSFVLVWVLLGLALVWRWSSPPRSRGRGPGPADE